MKKALIITALISLTGILVGAAALFPKTTELVRTPISEESFAERPDAAPEATEPSTEDTQQPLVSVAPVQASERNEFVPASSKQTEIRQSTETEQVYYPLRTANDPGYAGSWIFSTVNAPTGWDIATGNGSTVIAVIDTGYSLSHDDLVDTWYTNTGEIGTTTDTDVCWVGAPLDKQSNNCDDDANGYIDDWRGWNFVLGDNDPQAGREDPLGDAVSHGTETAGLSGASGNNMTGITTLNWNTKLMPLQALSDDGPGYTSDVAAAIYYAVDNGADVINLSLGGNTADTVMLAATNYAHQNGVVVVAAAGNCGTGTESGCSGYPAGFIGYPALNPHVISVGASTSTDQRASFGSYGEALDITAPGSGTIYTPTWTPENATSLYAASVQGTSYAAPLVSSLASLIKSIRPHSSVDDITALLLATARKPASMSGATYTTQLGHGIIDVATALTVATSLNTTEASPTLLQTGGPKSEHSYGANSTMQSGCITETAGSYCTIWMRDPHTGYDRYLPYKSTALSKQAGWTWNTTQLGSRMWDVRAVQGELSSSSYMLLRK